MHSRVHEFACPRFRSQASKVMTSTTAKRRACRHWGGAKPVISNLTMNASHLAKGKPEPNSSEPTVRNSKRNVSYSASLPNS